MLPSFPVFACVQVNIYIYISKGYASCRRPLDADWGLVTSGLAAQLGTWEHCKRVHVIDTRVRTLLWLKVYV